MCARTYVAVLAALRALQDKIKKLEQERRFYEETLTETKKNSDLIRVDLETRLRDAERDAVSLDRERNGFSHISVSLSGLLIHGLRVRSLSIGGHIERTSHAYGIRVAVLQRAD